MVSRPLLGANTRRVFLLFAVLPLYFNFFYFLVLGTLLVVDCVVCARPTEKDQGQQGEPSFDGLLVLIDFVGVHGSEKDGLTPTRQAEDYSTYNRTAQQTSPHPHPSLTPLSPRFRHRSHSLSSHIFQLIYHGKAYQESWHLRKVRNPLRFHLA